MINVGESTLYTALYSNETKALVHKNTNKEKTIKLIEENKPILQENTNNFNEKLDLQESYLQNNEHKECIYINKGRESAFTGDLNQSHRDAEIEDEDAFFGFEMLTPNGYTPNYTPSYTENAKEQLSKAVSGASIALSYINPFSYLK